MFMHFASRDWAKKFASVEVTYSWYSSLKKQDILVVVLDRVERISLWKSNLRYAAIIFEREEYSEIFIFSTTIFPEERTSANPWKVISSREGQKVFKISGSETKTFVILETSDFNMEATLESRVKNSFSKKSIIVERE